MTKIEQHPQHLEALLLRHLPDLLGDIEPSAVALLLEHLQWVEIAAGQTLMSQGDAGDAMYLLVSGRLRTYIANDLGEQRAVREIGRGQIVGEMSLFTDEPRSATLVAIRDSVLVRLGKDQFKQLLSVSGQISMALTQQIIKRLKTEGSRSLTDRPVTVGLIPITEGLDSRAVIDGLARELRRQWKVAVVDAASIEADLGEPGIAQRPPADTDANRRIAVRLDEIESAHDFVLLLSDSDASAWTQRCCRHCDELLLLADADQPVRLHTIEQACLLNRPPRSEAAEILLLFHPAECQFPRHTQAWLARRPLAGHLHLRQAQPRDIGRLARLLSRTGVGLVLSGGGARGAAHAGVYRALRERGVEIDVVGGTSMGAVFGGLVAMDIAPDVLISTMRRHFSRNPTADFNLIPMASLIKGLRLRQMMAQTIQELTGGAAGIEDLWKTFFCVAANYSQSREQVLQRGSLLNLVMASAAIPGALPPVIHDGDLLCDGGTFNNFPVDVMRKQWGVGRVLGVDLSFGTPKPILLQQMPSSWQLLRDRFRPKKRRLYRLPSLPNFLMNVTSLYSASRQREARAQIDLYFNPPLGKVGMLQWDAFDRAVQQGYEHACQVLDALPKPDQA